MPILNEKSELPELFASLAAQQCIRFELILCDGGSNDGSLPIAQELVRTAPFPAQLLVTTTGRGSQMNRGAELADASLLLFLHADSRLPAHDALATAHALYRQNQALATGTLAARFRLRFRRKSDSASLAYSYYEQKAHLQRSDCIRGDQGLLIGKNDFHKLGRFDTSLPFLEDLRLAHTIGESGSWLLIPAEISSSARRFESEGIYERQALNAVIACCAAIGWDQFFTALPSLYCCHGNHGTLDLAATMKKIRTLIAEQPRPWRRKFWRQVGEYVAANTWQIFFWLDVRREFYSDASSAQPACRWLSYYERHLAHFFTKTPVTLLASALTRLWLELQCRR